MTDREKIRERQRIGYDIAIGVIQAVGVAVTIIALFVAVCNTFNLFTDDSDKDGWRRSGATVVRDYKTGKEYLCRGGALIERAQTSNVRQLTP